MLMTKTSTATERRQRTTINWTQTSLPALQKRIDFIFSPPSIPPPPDNTSTLIFPFPNKVNSTTLH